MILLYENQLTNRHQQKKVYNNMVGIFCSNDQSPQVTLFGVRLFLFLKKSIITQLQILCCLRIDQIILFQFILPVLKRLQRSRSMLLFY